jgi:hypothetical protein
MRKTIVVLAVLALVAPALADLATFEPVKVGTAPTNVRGTDVYQNTTNFSGYLTSVPEGSLLGEDYQLAPGGRILDDLEFEVCYAGTAASMDLCDIDFYFYDGTTGTYIGGITFANIDTGGLLPYYSAFFSATGLESLGIVLPDTVIVLQSVYNIFTTGTGTHTWGRLLMNSYGEIGYSANDFYKDTTVGTPPGTQQGWYWFGDLTYLKANFYFAISTTPEPTSLALLALGALTLLRRR